MKKQSQQEKLRVQQALIVEQRKSLASYRDIVKRYQLVISLAEDELKTLRNIVELQKKTIVAEDEQIANLKSILKNQFGFDVRLEVIKSLAEANPHLLSDAYAERTKKSGGSNKN